MPREAAGRGEIVAKPLAVRQSRTASTKAVAAVPETTLARPAQREQVGAAIPAKFHGRAGRAAAPSYLTRLANAVLAGELSIRGGGRQSRLATSGCVVRTSAPRQRSRADHASVKLRWR